MTFVSKVGIKKRRNTHATFHVFRTEKGWSGHCSARSVLMLPFWTRAVFYLHSIAQWLERVRVMLCCWLIFLPKPSRGVWAMIAAFLAYCTLQAPSTWVNFLSFLSLVDKIASYGCLFVFFFYINKNRHCQFLLVQNKRDSNIGALSVELHLVCQLAVGAEAT